MICKKCGAEVPAGSFYCNVCGAEIQIVSEYNLENDIIDSYIGVELKTPEPAASPREKRKPDKRTLSLRFYRNIAIAAGVFAVAVLVMSALAWRHFTAQQRAAESFDYQLAQALSYYEDENYEMAVSYLDKALALSPDNAEVMGYLAQCYENLGEYSAAESIYRSLIALVPSEKSYFEHLVHIYESTEDYERIRELADLTEDPVVLAYLSDFSVPLPVFSAKSGEYDDDLSITITGENNAIIYYTTDGSDPALSGLVYTEPVRFEGEGRYLLRAVSQNSVNLFSDVAEETYTIEYPTPGAPSVSLPSGFYAGQQMLTVRVPEDHKAYYTLDGSTPTARSFPYQSPIVLPAGGQYLLKVVYISPHGKVGEVGTYTYLVTEL